MSTRFKPEPYHTLTPTLTIADGAGVAALEFYQKAFDAKETTRFMHQGKLAHAELQIGDSVVMLGEEMPEMGYVSPTTLGGTCGGFMLYVPDADTVVARAVAAGAKPLGQVQDQFYGDRSGTVRDPFGYRWTIATHKEDVSEAEMQRRFQELTAAQTTA
ncbi:MAG TPA: VOC family protein [Gemmatimonadaceae bacterium]|jgi:PhnB protein|nr:VOC family protein [Gemmatimonadaceae bacterium]